MSPGFDPGGPGTYVHLVSSPVFLLHLKHDQKDQKSDQRALLESSDTHWMRLPSRNFAYFTYLYFRGWKKWDLTFSLPYLLLRVGKKQDLAFSLPLIISDNGLCLNLYLIKHLAQGCNNTLHGPCMTQALTRSRKKYQHEHISWILGSFCLTFARMINENFHWYISFRSMSSSMWLVLTNTENWKQTSVKSTRYTLRTHGHLV